MDQIFNELSADRNYHSHNDAGRAIIQLGSLLKAMNGIGFSMILRTAEDFHSLQLCIGYTIYDCIRDNIEEPSVKLLLNNASKAPFIKDILNSEQKNALSEFRYKDREALGLGLAFLRDMPCLSLNCFEEGTVKLERSALSGEGEIQSSTVDAESIASLERFSALRKYLHTVVQREIHSGKDLLSQFSKLFPNLRLSKHAQDNISELTGNEEFFREFMRHFSVLSDAANDWKKGSKFMPEDIDCSYESKETLRQYENEHTFTCNDGKDRLFSAHSKIKSSNKRIYFLHDAGSRTVHIGHAGEHLPTVKYH